MYVYLKQKISNIGNISVLRVTLAPGGCLHSLIPGLLLV